MKKRLDLVSIGEILIDFIGKERAAALEDVSEFRRAAGGGPANVAAGAARLGMKAGFVGKVGADAFGRHLIQTMEQQGVETEGIIVDKAAGTTLVFVALNQKGVPDFAFFRNGTADTLLRPDELPMEMLAGTKILHFSSVSLTTEPSRSACLKAVEAARAAGAVISFDPNLRLPLWPDSRTAREEILAAAALADVLKMNDEEYLFLTGRLFGERDAAAEQLWTGRVKLLAVTCGENGSVLFTREDTVRFGGLPVAVVDTTGAGDAYMAGMLSVLAGTGPAEAIDRPRLELIGRWAGAAAALACQKPGGIPSLPDRETVLTLVNSP